MVHKLMVTILVLAYTGVSVLVLRQQRLLVTAEMTRAAERKIELDRMVWRVRAEIASMTTPARVRALVDASGVEMWETIPAEAGPDGGLMLTSMDAEPMFWVMLGGLSESDRVLR